MEELKTTEEIAKFFKVKPLTITRWRSEKGMPFIKIPNGTVRFKLTDCIKWAESNTGD